MRAPGRVMRMGVRGKGGEGERFEGWLVAIERDLSVGWRIRAKARWD